ncbi:MAG: glycosyltransferase family 4 protein [Lautropia sp.]
MRLLDLYGLNDPEPELVHEFEADLTKSIGRVNVFHLNGDEIAQSLPRVDAASLADAYNIVYPAWELARYPEPWAEQLARFDEVWAPSAFIRDAIAPAVSIPVVHMPLACQVVLPSFLSRRYFGIREDRFAFLFFFDFRSYASRKNPEAVIEAFRRCLASGPQTPSVLVIKLNGAENAPDATERLLGLLDGIESQVVVLNRTMSDNEVKNLVRVCDAFVSLHRSEGFGRGMAEAMVLGRPVIATAYSGNMDFMTPDNALCVDYRLVAVPAGAYPFAEGQVWAEPDVEQAARYMTQLLADVAAARALGQRAGLAVRRQLSYRKVGLRYLDRIGEVMRTRADAVVTG